MNRTAVAAPRSRSDTQRKGYFGRKTAHKEGETNVWTTRKIRAESLATQESQAWQATRQASCALREEKMTRYHDLGGDFSYLICCTRFAGSDLPLCRVYLTTGCLPQKRYWRGRDATRVFKTKVQTRVPSGGGGGVQIYMITNFY